MKPVSATDHRRPMSAPAPMSAGAPAPAAPSEKGDKGERSEKTRYNVMQPVYREGREKPFWQRLGTAFENPGRNGSPGSISVKLDSLPIGGDLVLFHAEEQQQEG